MSRLLIILVVLTLLKGMYDFITETGSVCVLHISITQWDFLNDSYSKPHWPMGQNPGYCIGLWAFGPDLLRKMLIPLAQKNLERYLMHRKRVTYLP